MAGRRSEHFKINSAATHNVQSLELASDGL